MGDSEQKKTKLHFYLLFIVACVGFGLFNYYYNTKCFEYSQKQILQIFEKSMRSSVQNTPKNANRQIEAISVANEKHQEEIKALLELQFNKIQNEYETQEIWTGILTIVFLIFSFYSLFKSEEMERQGKLALHSIEESEKGAQKALGSIEIEKKKKLNEIKAEYAKWTAEENKKYSRIVGATQSKSIASMKSEIRKLTEELESDYRVQATRYMNTLKDNSDKYIETLESQNADQIEAFIKSLEEKNAMEIQKQVDLWKAKMTELKIEYEKAINDIYEEHNSLHANVDADSVIHSDEAVEEAVKEEIAEKSVTFMENDEEIDEQLPIRNDGTA